MSCLTYLVGDVNEKSVFLKCPVDIWEYRLILKAVSLRAVDLAAL